MDNRVLIQTEEAITILLRALKESQLQAIAYRSECERLRKELSEYKERS